jgi:hypothetical protein
VRAVDIVGVHANQPLSSVEAFALALVEASSRLSSPTPVGADDDVAIASDEPVVAAE